MSAPLTAEAIKAVQSFTEGRRQPAAATGALVSAAVANLEAQLGTRHAIETLRAILRRLSTAAEREAREAELSRSMRLSRGRQSEAGEPAPADDA